jgi:hypothetical protein
MLKSGSIALAIAAVLSLSPANAKQRSCSVKEENQMVAKCGGYFVWINRGKNGCSYGFKGDPFYCNTKAGYLACEQNTMRLGCRRPLNND